MKAFLKNLFNEERGLETVEYAIIAGLIVVGVIATIASIGTWVNTKFGELLTALSS
ncbi:MAG: Flp family type IVb pilin [Sedimentisphaerales bacterium]|nr:Flp family type IVb pilin [Sedimentisphaerales bacterium]